MAKEPIHTRHAPAAIGTYSQAIRVRTPVTGSDGRDTVYLSGQIPLDPETMEVVTGDIRAQIKRVFDNLAAVAQAAGGTLNDAVRITVYLTDLANFSVVNEVMAEYFEEPYPARAAIGVAALPRGVAVEVDAILVL